MRIGIVIALLLSVGSLQAQIKNASSETSANPKRTSSVTPVAGQSKMGAVKEADIRRLMDLVGTRSLVTQMMDGMEQNIRPLMTSSLPEGEYRDRLIDLFFAKFHSKADPQQVLDLALPAYDRYYSDEEIKELIRFYETPLGRKTVSILPKLMGELQEAGRTWGEGLGRDSMMEVLSEHPELAKAMQTAKNAPPH